MHSNYEFEMQIAQPQFQKIALNNCIQYQFSCMNQYYIILINNTNYIILINISQN